MFNVSAVHWAWGETPGSGRTSSSDLADPTAGGFYQFTVNVTRSPVSGVVAPSGCCGVVSGLCHPGAVALANVLAVGGH